MTISASMPVRATYTGDGVTVNFPVPFIYFANSDGTKQIKVVLADANGENEVMQVENTNFTITDAGAVNGTLTMFVAPLSGYKLTIIYDIPIEQLTNYKEFGRLPSESIETAFDKVTAILKQHQEIIDRCIKVTISGNQTPEELLDEVYNKLDSATEIAAEAITAADKATTAANNASAAVKSAEQTLAEVTTYVDAAKVDINDTKTSAEKEINATVSEATATIEQYVSDAEAEVRQIARDEAESAIADAATEATNAAKANINAYVDDTVKPDLQTSVTAAANSASSAAASAIQAETVLENTVEQAEKATKSAQQAENEAKQAQSSNQTSQNIKSDCEQIKADCNAIKASLAGIYKWCGSVVSYNDLPAENVSVGDVYNVLATDMNYAWTEDGWDQLGSTLYNIGYGLTLADNTVAVNQDLVAMLSKFQVVSALPSSPAADVFYFVKES